MNIGLAEIGVLFMIGLGIMLILVIALIVKLYSSRKT